MSLDVDGIATYEAPAVVDEVKTSEEVYETSDGLHISTTRYSPVGVEPSAMLWCVPGGGCSRDYWDFDVRDEPRERYSFARYLARRGVVVVTADHLGSGESSRPVEERLRSSASLAAHMHAALLEARRDPALADLPVVGVGHSFGAGMTLPSSTCTTTSMPWCCSAGAASSWVSCMPMDPSGQWDPPESQRASESPTSVSTPIVGSSRRTARWPR